MAFKPLPTVIMTEESKQEKIQFPYPDFSDKSPVNDIANASQFEPQFSEQPLSTPATDTSSEEKKRMDELEKMLGEAQSRTAMIEQEAYDKAYAAGEKSGLALGEKRAEQIIQSMGLVLEQAEQELQALQEQSVDTVMDITTMVVEHVMGGEKIDLGQALEALIKQTLAQFLPSAEPRMVLAVHPQDLEMFKKMTTLTDQAHLQAAQSITPGTCRLMTAEQDALIDPKQSLDQAITHIRQQLMPHG
ncbi:MAG: FliH/SctL family protein [Ghiorsea sp.]|nr:FliH/SctL family protein [Ghiorsea sp.]